jgi:hypothetical protein
MASSIFVLMKVYILVLVHQADLKVIEVIIEMLGLYDDHYLTKLQF